MAATWDTNLIQRVGRAISLEQASRSRDRIAGHKARKISKYEITNAQFAGFLNVIKILKDGVFNKIQIINALSPDLQVEFINKSWKSKKGKENYPMVMVNYFEAIEFCNWKGGQLPKENEWISAVKGGNKSKKQYLCWS